MKRSWRLGSIDGTEIGVHYTWILIFALITWSLAQGFFPQAHPGWSTGAYWGTGVAVALLLFVSVLLHELGHSVVAQAKGMPVQGITLFIFGGVSRLEEEPEKPRTEFAMSIAGPLASLALAGVFWGLTYMVPDQDSSIGAMLGYLAYINAILAGFNLIPGFPLDGGRVLRSILWWRTGNLTRASDIGGRVGQGFGWAFIGFGMFQLLSGNFLGGLWIAFIGWFLSSAAGSSRRETTMQEQLTGISVGEVMDSSPATVRETTSLQGLVQELQTHHQRAAPVLRDSRVVGIVTTSEIGEVPQDQWSQTTAGDIATREPLYTVTSTDDLNTAMRLLRENDLNQLLVARGGQLEGMLDRADVIHYLQLSDELRIKPKPGKSQ